MSGINSVVLIGRLTADPECRKAGEGISVCRFTVAVDRRAKDGGADFVRCVAWRQSADYLVSYGNKGRLVGITGHIKTGSYKERDTDRTIYTTDVECDSVTLLDSRKDTQQTEQRADNFPAYSESDLDVPW
jgi:single-strand DNA-binding protein